MVSLKSGVMYGGEFSGVFYLFDHLVDGADLTIFEGDCEWDLAIAWESLVEVFL